MLRAEGEDRLGHGQQAVQVEGAGATGGSALGHE